MRKLISILGACLLLCISTGFANSGISLAKVIVALKPDKDPDKMIEERKVLEEYLSDALGKPVEVVIPLSASVILEGFANGTVDLGYLGASDVIPARKRGIGEILLAGEIDGKNSYQSYWLALKEKPYSSVEDLKGKPIAFASNTSTSGYIIPMYDLYQKNLIPEPNPELFFGKGNVRYGTGYVSAVELVLNGDAEAAAVSYYVLDKDKHLNAEQRKKLKKITEQGPVPTHVIAVRSSISPDDQKVLKNALLSMNEGKNQELRDKLFTSKLVEVEPEKHLSTLQAALKFLGLEK